MDVPASTCPLCNQMTPTNEKGELTIHFFNGEKCSRSETLLSRVEDTFAEHVLSEKASEALLNAMKNNSARPRIPIRRLLRKDNMKMELCYASRDPDHTRIYGANPDYIEFYSEPPTKGMPHDLLGLSFNRWEGLPNTYKFRLSVETAAKLGVVLAPGTMSPVKIAMFEMCGGKDE